MTTEDARARLADRAAAVITDCDGRIGYVIDPATGAAMFIGRPRVFFLAICNECNEGRRPLPMPFGTETDRDTWAEGHRTTGHTVNEALEIRR